MQHAGGQVRIIGGRLKGRKIAVPQLAGLRPTPDRVRETLFNWLAPHIAGMRVLDLFAGTGALGLEALSRGAATLTMVESNRTAAHALRETLARFGLAGVRLETTDALQFLRQDAATYDLIFLDPPYAAGLLAPALALSGAPGRLAPGGFCYVELPRDAPLPALPEGWGAHRAGTAGEVGYHLLHGLQSDLSGHI